MKKSCPRCNKAVLHTVRQETLDGESFLMLVCASCGFEKRVYKRKEGSESKSDIKKARNSESQISMVGLSLCEHFHGYCLGSCT